MTGAAVSPVSFAVHVARLPKNGMPVVIDASEGARLALAREHGLEDVESFRAELLVTPWRRDGVRITGRVESKIVQLCVVTLVPVHSTIKTDIDVILVAETSKLARNDTDESGEILLDPDGVDAPDTYSGDTVDVGTLAEEHFELAIDPYPRAPGAKLETGSEDEAERAPSPFAKLAQLRRND
ncbi:MAG: DUF177 domain-containing protein [Notoacmeibacter sp.]|nr:DUF177 domain-containing protein [Notoacmeibacter sp.]